MTPTPETNCPHCWASKQELKNARAVSDTFYRLYTQACERAEKAEANLRRAIEIAEIIALHPSVARPPFRAELDALKATLNPDDK